MRRTITIDSEALNETRLVHIIQSDDFALGQPRVALFCTDGQSVDAFSRLILADPTATPLLVIGVESNPVTRDYDYVRGYDPERFEAHKKFWFQEMLPSVTGEFDLMNGECCLGLAGYSNGATFAHSTVAEHPEKFSFGIIFSAADNRIRLDEYRPAQPSKFYLAAGTNEPDYLRTTRRIANDLESVGIRYNFVERLATHDIGFWSSELPTAVKWIIGE